MKDFKITFLDLVRAETVEDAYDDLLKYLREVVEYQDVTAFNFEEWKL